MKAEGRQNAEVGMRKSETRMGMVGGRAVLGFSPAAGGEAASLIENKGFGNVGSRYERDARRNAFGTEADPTSFQCSFI